METTNKEYKDIFFRCYRCSGMNYFREDFDKLQSESRYRCAVRPAPTSTDSRALGAYINGKLLGWINEDIRDDLKSLLPYAKETIAYVYNENWNMLRIEMGLQPKIPIDELLSFKLDGTRFFQKSFFYSPAFNYECTFKRVPNNYNKKALRVLIEDTPVGFISKSDQEQFDSILPRIKMSYVNIGEKKVKVLLR